MDVNHINIDMVTPIEMKRKGKGNTEQLGNYSQLRSVQAYQRKAWSFFANEKHLTKNIKCWEPWNKHILNVESELKRI